MSWDALPWLVALLPVLYVAGVGVFIAGSTALCTFMKRGSALDADQTRAFSGVRFGPLDRLTGLVEETLWQSLAWATAVLYGIGLLRLPRGKPNDPPVIVLPGWTENGGTLWWLVRGLAKSGYDPIALDFPSTHHPIERNAAFLEERLRAIRAERGGEELPVVAHSMGGLVTRTLMLREPNHGIRTLVAISTPFRGTRTAVIGGWFFGSPACRDMTPGSAYLQAHGPERKTGVPILSIVAFQENIVCPEWSAVLPEATNVVLDRAWGHEAPLFSDTVLGMVGRWLARPGSS